MLGNYMMEGARLPTIRELVGALATRDGVEGVVLLGRDGLVIDGRTAPGMDMDHVAAHVPALVTAADELSGRVGRGGLITAVLEYEKGMAVVTTLTTDALLVLLVKPTTNLGALLLDLRRHRSHIASIV